jgi:arginine decarboxylase
MEITTTKSSDQNSSQTYAHQKNASWNAEKSAKVYGINNWGNGYFKVNSQGHVVVTPKGDKGPSADLFELTQELQDRGLRMPIMIRFPDIINERVQLLYSCFQKAFVDHNYKGNYCGVYPK